MQFVEEVEILSRSGHKGGRWLVDVQAARVVVAY
jgi:hypothetical protein